MKRMIAFLLTLLMIAPMLVSVSSAAESEFSYTDEEIDDLYLLYEDYTNNIFPNFDSKDDLHYLRSAENFTEKDKLKFKLSSQLMGEYPNKEFYADILTKMVTLSGYDLAKQLESQTEFDNPKSAGEYAAHVFDIVASGVGDIDKLKKFEKALSAINGVNNVVSKTSDELIYLGYTFHDYTENRTLLDAIVKNTDNPDLKAAASDLLTANELLCTERLEILNQRVEHVALHTTQGVADTLLENYGLTMLKDSDKVKNNPALQKIVSLGEGAIKALKKVGNFVKIGTLINDVLFGATNTFRHYNEFMAMTDIANALIKAINKVDVSPDADKETLYSDIYMKLSYYKLLLSVHLRGEYLAYSIVYEDAGMISEFVKWLEKLVYGEPLTKYVYQKNTKNLSDYYDKIDDIFDWLDGTKSVVYEGFELHDGFIVPVERKTEVPEGYIGIYTFDDFNKIALECSPDEYYWTSRSETTVTESNTKSYILMNDISFPSTYEPPVAFYGTLDGNGYTMSGVPNCLFGCIGNAVIKNLGIEISYYKDYEDLECDFGAITRGINAFYDEEGCIIDNCFVKGSIEISCRSGEFGGLIGSDVSSYMNSPSIITNCYNEADISIHTRQGGNLGGICGQYGNISNCFNTGDLNMYATCASTMNPEWIDVYVGGIQGYLTENLTNCYNTGNISGRSERHCRVYTGGIAGFVYAGYGFYGVENCYNTGNISNNCIEEYDAAEEYDYALDPHQSSGGIIGWVNGPLNINKCFNSGAVSGENYSGGILGISFLDLTENIMNCCNTGDISAVQYAGGIVGKDYYNYDYSSKNGDESLPDACLAYCLNTGSITDAMQCGALVGDAVSDGFTILDCYYLDNGNTVMGDSLAYSGAYAVSAEQLTDKDTFNGFDFVYAWRLRDGDDLPTPSAPEFDFDEE